MNNNIFVAEYRYFSFTNFYFGKVYSGLAANGC